MENIELGLMLLCIGMTTVFCALLIIIFCSRLLIRAVNRFFPETQPVSLSPHSVIDKRRTAVITAAVHAFTQGKGHVQKIEKM